MQTDDLLNLLAEKIQSSIGAPVSSVLTGNLALPPRQWSGFDFLEFLARLRQDMPQAMREVIGDSGPEGTTRFCVQMATRCATLGEALSITSRIIATVTDSIEMVMRSDSHTAVLEFRERQEGLRSHSILTDFHLLTWYRTAEWLIGSAIPLLRVDINHPLDAPYSIYASAFGTTCHFNCDAGRLVFPVDILDARVVTANPTPEQLGRQARMSFPQAPGIEDNWRQRVRKMFQDYISDGRNPPRLEELAEQFCITSQTLRRRLRAEGTSYRELIAEIRYTMAVDVLADDHKSVFEASSAAGYAEASALTRALKTRSGMSSSELRHKVRQWRGSAQNGRS